MKSKILKNKNYIIIGLLVVIFVIKVIIARSYNNVEWEPDSYMHFLQLKTVFANFPQNINIGMNAWAKPLYIYPLGFLVAIFNVQSVFFVEIINVLIFSVVSFLVYKIVLKIYGNFFVAVFALIATSFSLTLFKSSASTLTEPVFTLFLISSLYFTIGKRYYLAGLLVGLSVLGRIEGLFFIGMYLLFILLSHYRNKREIINNSVITLAPIFLWNLIGFLTTGNILYVRTFFQSYSINDYGKGDILGYPRLFITKEFLITIIFILSVFAFAKFYKKFKFKKEILYWGIISATFIFVQIIFWLFGLFGTAGLMRYFVCVIPFMIIFESSIFFILKERISLNRFRIVVIVISVLQVVLTFFYLNGIIFRTKEFPTVEQSYVQAGEWIKSNISSSEFLAADRPEVIYYSGRDLTNSRTDFNKEFNENKNGIYVWTEWSVGANNITKEQIEMKSILLKSFDGKVFVYKIGLF